MMKMQKAPSTQRKVAMLRRRIILKRSRQAAYTVPKFAANEQEGLLNENKEKNRTKRIQRSNAGRTRQNAGQTRKRFMEGNSAEYLLKEQWVQAAMVAAEEVAGKPCKCRERMCRLEWRICHLEQYLERVLGQLTPNCSEMESVVMGQPGVAPPVPLHEAAEHGDIGALVRALVRGEDPNALDQSKDTVLHCAVRSGEALSVELLLASGASLYARDARGATPLANAVVCGHQRTVEILLERGAQVELRDKDGRTPLMRAVGLQNTEMTSLLLKHGARVNVLDHNGKSPLVTAACDCSVDILTLLVCHSNPSVGQMVQAMNVAGCSAAFMILVQEMPMAATCSMKNGLLVRVAKEGWLHPVETILNNCVEHQCESKFHNKNIQSAIMVAKTEDVLLVLWESAPSTMRREAMSRAAAMGWPTVLEAIISHFENSKTKDFSEIVDALRNAKALETAFLLVEAYPPVARTSVGRETALQAAEHGWYNVLEALIQNGVSVNSRWNKSLLLHIAASRGNTECVRILVCRGAYMQERDYHGRTPLHCAAEAGHSLVVDILLKKGADPTAKDSSGRTPYKVATTEDIRILLKPWK